VNPLPRFEPKHPPGVNLEDVKTRAEINNYLQPVDFFKLFFTHCLVSQLCAYTNQYAEEIGPNKPSMFSSWSETYADEFYRFLGLLMYMSIVGAPNLERYYSNKSLYSGLWAMRFLPKLRLKQLMCFLKIRNNEGEDPNDKLSKARFLMEFIRRKCQKLFQPFQNICIDERMVRNKGRYSFRQYIRDKPTKWGMKLWVLADSSTGYTYDFDVYLGKKTASSGFGLAYDVVMNLVQSLVHQGYHLFFDNFYTSVQLLRDLIGKGIRACGTIIANRKGFPQQLKNVKGPVLPSAECIFVYFCFS